MPLVVIPDGATEPVLISSGDTILLEAGDTFLGTSIHAQDSVSDVSIRILGEIPISDMPIFDEFLPGIYFRDSREGPNTVFVGETGRIESMIVRIGGDGSRLINEGEIVESSVLQGLASPTEDLVSITGDDIRFWNTGEILNAAYRGVSLVGRNIEGRNTGTIEGAEIGVDMNFAGSQFFANTGQILSSMIGITIEGDNVRLFNSGLISSEATYLDDIIVSTRDISTAAEISGNQSVFVNTGTVIGEVKFSGVSGGSSRYIGAGGEVQGTITFRAGNDRGFGGDFAEVMFGGAGKDILQGRGGDDTLHGGDFNDWLFGGEGDDQLNGGNGYNFLTGGSGADTFVFEDTSRWATAVRDFETGVDTVEIVDVFADFEAVLLAARETERGVEITLTRGGKIILEDLEIADLSAEDFALLNPI